MKEFDEAVALNKEEKRGLLDFMQIGMSPEEITSDLRDIIYLLINDDNAYLKSELHDEEIKYITRLITIDDYINAIIDDNGNKEIVKNAIGNLIKYRYSLARKSRNEIIQGLTGFTGQISEKRSILDKFKRGL